MLILVFVIAGIALAVIGAALLSLISAIVEPGNPPGTETDPEDADGETARRAKGYRIVVRVVAVLGVIAIVVGFAMSIAMP